MKLFLLISLITFQDITVQLKGVVGVTSPGVPSAPTNLSIR